MGREFIEVLDRLEDEVLEHRIVQRRRRGLADRLAKLRRILDQCVKLGQHII